MKLFPVSMLSGFGIQCKHGCDKEKFQNEVGVLMPGSYTFSVSNPVSIPLIITLNGEFNTDFSYCNLSALISKLPCLK